MMSFGITLEMWRILQNDSLIVGRKIVQNRQEQD